MNVLHICSYYITSKLYQNLVSGLSNTGIQNYVYIPVNSYNLINKNYKEGIKKAEFTYSKCFNKIDRISFKIKTNKIYKDLLSKIELNKIDISHAHSLFINGYIAYKLKKEKNIDYIVAVRNTDVNVFLKYIPWMRPLGIKIMHSAKKVIFISPSYKDQVIDKYVNIQLKNEIKEKSVVIPNGVDSFWLKNFYCREKERSPETKTLIYVGTIDKNKNITTTIESVEILKKRGYSIKFDIIGEGKEKENIKGLIKGEKSKYINMHNYMQKESLIKKYRNSDVFVMPSKTETFGLVYVEAITQGLPVIYTENQGFDGFFKEGEVGFSVKCTNPVDIADKIELILNKNIDIRRVEPFIKEKFDWNNIAKEYKYIYFE